MRMRDFFVVLLIFALVTIGGSYFFGDLTKIYGVSSQNISVLVPVSEIREEAEQMETQLRETQTGIAILDIPFTVVRGAYTLLKLMLIKVPELWFTFISSIGELLGIPSWASGIIITLLLFTLIFEIISVIMKWKT